ncbi:4-alpha-glucanotransferase [Desulfovibrio cuneatus]|uniref:4-alpha-glucanotransferase n=1 Tax=Desulfovibrio cuneatus TaxID=159728 RepID=UPI0004031EA8|nr:4-alpha-glucanotransferase [Desulfovibrio cuneatus]
MRSLGVLLHISSLPSAFGIGDLGPEAFRFACLLHQCGAKLWQVLPLNPTTPSLGNSPYASPSAFAGNPLFISPELLVQQGWLAKGDLSAALGCLEDAKCFGLEERVNFPQVHAYRDHLYSLVFEKNVHRLAEHEGYARFCAEHAWWLHEYARFECIKAEQGGAAWVHWPKPLAQRQPEALAAFDARSWRALERIKFIQYLFFAQWQQLRAHCAGLGIALLGDVPIYVTHDSADVWANPNLFVLDDQGNPVEVAGVPPDYFSETGQRWGNPLYRWDRLETTGFDWWKKRLSHALLFTDRVRLDHFRGFCGYWAIPATEATGQLGQWRQAPGQAFLQAMHDHLGGLPLVAEDLGIITQDVKDLMHTWNLPGMRVLQFGFGGENLVHNPNVPFCYPRRSVVYTGTHDNATTRQWFFMAGEGEKAALARYTGRDITEHNVIDVLLRLAFGSVADLVVVPAQDVLGLGAEGRMNTPGTTEGNWGWRMRGEEAQPHRFMYLKDLAALFGRLG